MSRLQVNMFGGEDRGHYELSFGDISEMPLDSPVQVATWIQGGGLG